MSKTPEEYFQEQSFSLPKAESGGAAFSSAELAFIRKYMGLDAPDALRKIGLDKKAESLEQERAKPAPAGASPVDALILSLGEERPEANVPKKLTDVLGAVPVSDVAEKIEASPPVPAAPPVAEKIEASPAVPTAPAEDKTEEAAAPVQPVAQAKAASPADSASQSLAQDLARLAASTPVVWEQPGPKDAAPAPPVSQPSVQAAERPAAAPNAPAEPIAPVQPATQAKAAAPADPAAQDLAQELARLAASTPVVREQPGPTAPAPAVSQPPAQEAAHPAEAPGVPVAPAVPKQPGPKVATPAPAVSQPAAQSSSSAEGSGASTAKTVAAGGAPEKAAVTDVSAAETSKLKTAKQPQGSPEAKPTKPTMADIYDGMDIGDALDHFLRNETELQMVAFYVGDQEFTVPTVIVQEVIHYSTPVKLPVAPPFVAGVINLRGKVTPLVYLRDILEVPQKEKREDRFIVICRYQGLQIGLIIEKVHSMYRVTQKDIDWGIEAHLGINVDYVSGLLKHDDHLIGIVAVDKIVTNILSDEKK